MMRGLYIMYKLQIPAEIPIHFLLYFVSLFSRGHGEIFSTGGINYCPCGIDQQTTFFIHAMFGNLLQVAALGSDARNKEKIFRRKFPDRRDLIGLRGTHHEHELAWTRPPLCRNNHFL